jgi:hypothetical protein
MQKHTLGLAIAAVSILTPALSHAWGGKTSLDACVSAFEKSLGAPQGTSRTFKVIFSGDRFGDTLSQFFPMTYTFDLAANDPKSGKIYARARCLADSRGAVASLSPLPLLEDPSSPSLARAAD